MNLSITLNFDVVYWLALLAFLASMFYEAGVLVNRMFARDGDLVLAILGIIFRYGSAALLTYTLTVQPTIT